MDRRTLLRALAVTGLAGCTRTAPAPEQPPVAAATPSSPTPPAPTATPVPSPEPPPPEPSPAAQPRTVTAISRELLGLEPARPGGTAHTITGLMLHHTAAPTVAATEAPGRFRSHARGHVEAGFVDVAYHWGVDVDGNVYELRDEAIAGETFTSYDPAGWFLVVCEGNFEESQPTPAMLGAVADVFAAGAARYGVAPSTLTGHRDHAATACPGDNLQAVLGDLRTAIAERLDAGGVELVVGDDPALLPG